LHVAPRSLSALSKIITLLGCVARAQRANPRAVGQPYEVAGRRRRIRAIRTWSVLRAAPPAPPVDRAALERTDRRPSISASGRRCANNGEHSPPPLIRSHVSAVGRASRNALTGARGAWVLIVDEHIHNGGEIRIKV
jgi:hypothetical protein